VSWLPSGAGVFCFLMCSCPTLNNPSQALTVRCYAEEDTYDVLHQSSNLSRSSVLSQYHWTKANPESTPTRECSCGIVPPTMHLCGI
jgi:hypothetical protein